MAKEVIYNGKDVTKHGTGVEENKFEEGAVYEVRQEIHIGGSIYYEFYYMEGIYSSQCFDLVAKPTFFVVARKVPKRGECMENYMLFKKGMWDEMLKSTQIQAVRQIGINTYEAETEKNILLVQVI